MLLNAKARLLATMVTAAKDDAKHLRKALVDSVDLFSNAVSHTAGGDPTGAAKQLKMAMSSIAAAAKKTFGKSVVYIDPTLNEEINSKKAPAVFGGIVVNLRAPNGKEFEFSWEFNIHEAYPGRASCWVAIDPDKHFEYEFNTAKGFDSSKCMRVMDKAMDYFENKGFSK